MTTYGYSWEYNVAGQNRVLILTYKPFIYKISYSLITPNDNCLLNKLQKSVQEII